MDVLTIFSRQKKGGTYEPPAFPTAPFCILCQKGCKCIGICCQGPRKLPPQSSNIKILPPSSIIPGLIGDTTMTTLTKPTKTSKRRRGVPFSSDIYCFKFKSNTCKRSKPKPRTSQDNPSIFSKLAATKKHPSTRNKISQEAEYNSQKLKKILLHSSLNDKSTTKTYNSKGLGKGDHITSLHRKLSIAEVGCRRKPSSKHSLLSMKNHHSDNIPHPPATDSSPGSSSPQVLELLCSSAPETDPLSPKLDHLSNSPLISLERQAKSPDELPNIEILRTSPQKPRKRKQSASPDYHQSSHKTPTKNTPVREKSKGHTPRKDTPTKKRIKYQCRNAGCSDFLANLKSRDRHESTYCRFRSDIEAAVSMENQFPVPDHNQLNLDSCQCRHPSCLKIYKTEGARKKHEMEKHRYFEKKGRTVSPVSFYQLDEDNFPGHSRPTSCPPLDAGTGSVFSTPVCPTKRRRTASSSETPTSCPSWESSPLRTPDLSLTSSPGSSVSSNLDLESQNIFDVKHPNQCSFCLFIFTN